MRFFIYFVFSLAVNFALAQEIQISNLSVSDSGRVVFDVKILSKSSERELYQLIMYSSKDEYAEPLNLDLGPIQADSLYTISFDGLKEIGEYTGPIRFKFKAEAVLFPVTVDELKKSTLISGKKFTLSWTDYHESGWYKVELYKDGEPNLEIVDHHRGNLYQGQLPKKMEKGDYELVVTPTDDEDLKSEVVPIVIKRPVNPLLVVVPALLVGGSVIALTRESNEPMNLPNPPDPPDN